MQASGCSRVSEYTRTCSERVCVRVPIYKDAGVRHMCAGEQNSDGLTHGCIHGRILRAQVIQARPRAGRVGGGGERGTERIERLTERLRE